MTGGVTERYVYAGVETIATYDGSNTWKQDFVFGQGIDNVLMLEQADVLDFDSDQNTTETTRSFYHKNALGSVMAITDMNEATAVSYRYDPYGEVTVTRGWQTQSADPLQQHWTYPGRFFDEETGLYYYRARCFGPEKGRFLERDPLGYQVGPHLYNYAGDRPIGIRDPLGLDGLADPDRAGPEPGSANDPGGFDENRGGGQFDPFTSSAGTLEFRLDVYFWIPRGHGPAGGLYVQSRILVFATGCKTQPGTSLPCPNPRLTVEYFRLDGYRTKIPDTHSSTFMTGYCAGTVHVSFTLTLGALIVRDPNTGDWTSGAAYYRAAAYGYVPPATHTTFGLDNVHFTPLSRPRRWYYQFNFDQCTGSPSRIRCSWDRITRPRLREDPVPKPPVITPSD